MARILYGINGEGMGHAFRSKPIIDELKKHHRIEIITSYKAFQMLSKDYRNIHEVSRASMIYRNAKIHLPLTVIENAKDLPKSLKSLAKVHRLIKKFKPDIIITDFEPFTNIAAKVHKIPLVAFDNPSVLRKCRVDVPISQYHNFAAAYFVCGCMVNFADYYLLTTFFDVKPKQKKVLLFPPVIRKEVLRAKRCKGRHVIVYQTGHNYDHLIPLLKENPKQKFIVYGCNEEKVDGNIAFKPLGKTNFIKDLASCRAVITNGGFTLMSEAIALKKPILSVPVQGQFEQILNSINLEKRGFGEYHKAFSAEIIRKFLKKLKKYEKNLSKQNLIGNTMVLNKIEEIISSLK